MTNQIQNNMEVEIENAEVNKLETSETKVEAIDVSKLNIYQKLAKCYIHEQLLALKKENNVKLGYRVLLADPTFNACKKVLSEYKIVLAIDNDLEVNHFQYDKINKNGVATSTHYFILKGTARLINADNPTEQITSYFCGSAEDSSDKGIGKATTYAKKIALTNFFLISDEDTDDTPSADNEGQNIEKSKTTLPANEKPTSKCVEIFTNDNDVKNMLKSRNWKETQCYRDKTTPVLSKWLEQDKILELENWFTQNKYSLNKEKNYYEKTN